MKSGYTYYVQNAHGDVVNLTDADGTVTKTYRYDAFGVEFNLVAGDVNVFRYCGEYFDTETGTIYLRARYYQASIGRFTQRDTVAGKLGDPLSLNLYTYAHNNPIFYFDPSGHKAGNHRGGSDYENKFDEARHVFQIGFEVAWISAKKSSWGVGMKEIAEYHMIGTSMIQEHYKDRKGTFSICSGGSAGLGPLYGGATSGFCFDYKGNIGFQYNYSSGIDPRSAQNPNVVFEEININNNSNPIQLSGGIYFGNSDAASIDDLKGQSVDIGVNNISTGSPYNLDASLSFSYEDDELSLKNPSRNIGVTVGGSGAGVYVQQTYTGVEKIGNIYDTAYSIDRYIMSW